MEVGYHSTCDRPLRCWRFHLGQVLFVDHCVFITPALPVSVLEFQCFSKISLVSDFHTSSFEKRKHWNIIYSAKSFFHFAYQLFLLDLWVKFWCFPARTQWRSGLGYPSMIICSKSPFDISGFPHPRFHWFYVCASLSLLGLETEDFRSKTLWERSCWITSKHNLSIFFAA